MEEFDEDRYSGAEDDVQASGNEDGDEFETMLDIRPKDTWAANSAKKNEVVRELIKCFGSMVESHAREYAIPDIKGRFKPDDLVYVKLLDAPKYVAKAKRALILNENFDTREFSIFIANKRWVRNILRPLLELCAKEDSILAMRCASLALVLIRRISEASQKVLTDATRGSKRKPSSLDLQQNEDDKEEDEKGTAVVSDKTDEQKEKAALLRRIDNVKQQVSALLSFKDALCSDKCNEAIANAFKEFWLKEQVESSEDNKTGVAICFSYLRRILAIEAHAQWSTPGELHQHRLIHDRYIVQLRLLISVLPGVVSDLLRPYHNDWLGDVLLIIFFTLRGFEPKEMYRVWRTGALVEDFENFDSYDSDLDEPSTEAAALAAQHKKAVAQAALHPSFAPTAVPPAAAKKVIDVIIPTSLAQANRQSAAAAGKGKLSQLLSKERSALQANLSTAGSSRFRGVYQRTVAPAATLPAPRVNTAGPTQPATNSALDHILGPAPSAPTTSIPANPLAPRAPAAAATAAKDSAESADMEGAVVCHTQVAKILRNPFAQTGAVIPQAQAKRNKKNLTFALDTTLNETQQGGASYLTSDDHQKAAVVASTLANLLASELCLKPLVKRVNEDLRRDDMRVGQELELRYFDILYRVLHYNRLKLADEYADHLQAAALAGPSERERVWEPNLKNVMDALDRMSFTRVVTAVERVGKNAARAEDVVVPLSLYKEMICYLRVLLESGLEGHHEIAIAALHRLFYASSERLDPLPRLLTAWKSGTFPRRHLYVLVELVHETLKTLEAAQVRFRPEGDRNAEEWARKKYKRKGGKNEMDLEQYVMACMRFKPDDYFKKLVTNQTVRMYTKLLSHYAQNDNSVNHYAYCFLRRMNAFTLEQEYRTPAVAKPAAVPNTGSTGPSLTAPSSTSAASDEVSLAFMLFNYQTLEVFEKIINDREAYNNKSLEPLIRLIKAIIRRFGEASEKNHMLYVELLFQHQRPHDFCCTLDSVYEAPAYAAYTSALHKRGRHGQRGAGSGSDSDVNSGADGARSSSEDDDLGDEFDENNVTEAFKAQLSEKQKKRLARQQAKEAKQQEKASRREKKEAKRARLAEQMSHRLVPGRAAAAVRFAWTVEEDEVLKKEYARYAGSRSVFYSIAQSEDLRAFGKHRSEAQISKRCRELNLAMMITFSDDEEEEEEEGGRSAGATKARGGAVSSAAAADSNDFGGIIFSDHDGDSDGGLEVPFSPSPPGGAWARRAATAAASGAAGDTQVDTQLDTQHTVYSPVSPAARRRTRPAARDTSGDRSGGSGNDFAGLFSPSDTSLNEDFEKEARQDTATQLQMHEQEGTQTQSQNPFGETQRSQAATQPSAKKARLRDSSSAATSRPSAGRAAWDLDEGELNLLDQRAMALARATGNASYGFSDDDGNSPAAKKATGDNGRRGLKRPKPSARGARKASARADSDGEDDVFGSDAEGAAVEQTQTQTQQQVQGEGEGVVRPSQQDLAAQKAALYKKRSLRIDSDDEDI